MKKSVIKKDDVANYEKLLKKARTNMKNGKAPIFGFTAKEDALLRNRYSHFEDKKDKEGFLSYSEHVVTNLNTPRPYMHLISSNHDNEFGMFGSFWDQTGLGFSCLDSVLAGPLTSHKDRSYVPTSPKEADFRAFYLYEEKSNGKADIWYMNPQAGREEEKYKNYKTIQGLGFNTIEAERNKIKSECRTFVPYNDPCEIWTITLENTSNKTRKIKLFSKLTWDLSVHPGYYFDPRSTSAGDVLKEENAIIARQLYKKNALPRTGLMMSDKKFDGFDLSAEDFLGGHFFSIWPKAVEEGQCANSLGFQPYMGLIGAMQFNVTIKPGEKKKVNIFVGNTKLEKKDYQKDAKKYRKKYFTNGGVEKEFQKIVDDYNKMHKMATVDCPDDETNRIYNVWLKYQAKNTARWIRALDQVGYRDILQDLLGICNFAPGLVKNHLPTVLNYQLKTGQAIRQFFKYPDTHAPNDERMYSDSPLWIADTLVAYIEETGDFSILKQMVGFYDLKTHKRNNKIKKSVYEHCRLGIMQAFNTRGKNGLCLVGYGDWNDAMDGLAPKGKGVSAWLSMCLIFAASRFLKLAEFLKDKKNIKEMKNIINVMTQNVNKGAWDGDHYIFGFNDDGKAIGTQTDKEGKVHCVANAWAFFTGVAKEANREKHLMKVMKRLDDPLGHHVVDIPYTQKNRDLVGRICDKAPGLSENGSIYTHGHAFYVYGLISMGLGDMAFDELKKMLPQNSFPDITTGSPHQQSNFTTGKFHPEYGKNYFNNFSGSCPWFLKCWDAMFGVLADFDGVEIKPCAPKKWKSFRYRKIHLGIRYIVEYENKSGDAKVKKVTANGINIKAVSGKFKLYASDYKKNSTIKVIVEM